MTFSTVIRHPVVKWLRRLAALLLAVFGLFWLVLAGGLLHIPSGDAPGARDELLNFRHAEIFITNYLDKNGHFPDRETLEDWAANVNLSGHPILSVDSECSESNFAKAKTDRFVISDWRGEFFDCFASPSGKHTLVMSAREEFWSDGGWRALADFLAFGFILIWLSWLLWPGDRLIKRTLPHAVDMALRWFCRLLSPLTLVSAVVLFAASGYSFFLLTENVAKAKVLKNHFHDAAIVVTDYKAKHGRYPDRSVLQAWVRQQRPSTFDNMHMGNYCDREGFTQEKGDQFSLSIVWSYDDTCYAYPSGRTSFPTTIFSSLIDGQGSETELQLFAACLSVWFAWRLWPRRAKKADS